jgi:glutathione S-transferase
MTRRRSYRLYHLDGDGPCSRVRERLTALEVTWHGVVVPAEPDERTDLLDLTGQRRVPVLVDGEILVIGEREIIAYVERTLVVARPENASP